ncbi:DNA (cytosine-5-)-methyltransferase [Cysteiniphilum halobium]|uniref:DNA (cytosine-5-)-methyltransferase n=1 Tax=Cysteiniphilum halobium TaxID=2219059 RepID=UPI003F858724
MKEYYSLSEISDILSVSKETLRRWDKSGKLTSIRHPINNYRVYHQSQILQFEQARLMLNSNWDAEMNIKPFNEYHSIEIFAGAGGLALGLEKAGFKHVFLNEIDKDACATLRHNRPHWNIDHADISIVDFNKYKHKIDLLSGGFPCQAFSYAGKKLGFDDIRGTLFFEFARAAKEIQPRVLLAENVRGLLSHDNGNTFRTIKEVFDEIGYVLLIEPKVLKAIFFQVPQKRERLFFVAVRKDLFFDGLSFHWPSPYKKILTLKDVLKKGDLYDCDVPESIGSVYPKRKREILDHVPQGGYWRHLPDDLQKEYMQKSYFLGGGKTGMARRLSWEEPSLTLTCAPAQKQTERCHPEETRPLTIREYARIQTFPDDWKFCGSMSSQYKQIGNAVPVNLSYAVGRSIVNLLNQLS